MSDTKTMSGGQAAVDALRNENVKHVFGLIGSATMEMFDALYEQRDNIQLIGVRDERTGTHMADAYARVTGEAGVVLAGQNGPGATNLVTGLSQAKAAYSPVVSYCRNVVQRPRLPRRIPRSGPTVAFHACNQKNLDGSQCRSRP